MNILDKIKTIYPDITDEMIFDGTIKLQNDSDFRGDYIAEWNHNQPRPTQEQLDALND